MLMTKICKYILSLKKKNKRKEKKRKLVYNASKLSLIVHCHVVVQNVQKKNGSSIMRSQQIMGKFMFLIPSWADMGIFLPFQHKEDDSKR